MLVRSAPSGHNGLLGHVAARVTRGIEMNVTAITPILNVSDVPGSIEWFERLGWTCGFTYSGREPASRAEATFASVCAGEGQIFLCKDGQGIRGGRPPRFEGDGDRGATWLSIGLAEPVEVDRAHARATSAGVLVIWPPTDEPWGVRECRLMHPDGHVFRISAPLEPDHA